MADAALLQKASVGDAVGVTAALDTGADASHQRESDGASALMLAASCGCLEAVTILLQRGSPWNLIDRRGKNAGDYAVATNHQAVIDALVAFGVESEVRIRAARDAHVESDQSVSNRKYLDRGVHYSGDDKLLDDDKRGVMMSWEDPLMAAHAEILCEGQGDILNVGFGMGIIDTYIQQRKPKTHTIIEAHPDVYNKMIADGWDKKAGVKVVFGRWQDVQDQLAQYDGIFFDTFDDDFESFHFKLPALLRTHGRYSFFNGIHPENLFFQGVACQVLTVQLQQLGFTAQFVRCDVDCADKKLWEGVQFNYFDSGQYFLPVVEWTDRDDTPQQQQQQQLWFQQKLDAVPAFVEAAVTALQSNYGINIDCHGDKQQLLQIDHVCWRCETIQEYLSVKQQLVGHGATLLVESMIGGRPIATYKLATPIACRGGRSISLIEVPCPKQGSPYASGWEHAEVVVGGDVQGTVALEAFAKCYPTVTFKPASKAINADLSLNVAPTAVVKFHQLALDEVIAFEIQHGFIVAIPEGYFNC